MTNSKEPEYSVTIRPEYILTNDSEDSRAEIHIKINEETQKLLQLFAVKTGTVKSSAYGFEFTRYKVKSLLYDKISDSREGVGIFFIPELVDTRKTVIVTTKFNSKEIERANNYFDDLIYTMLEFISKKEYRYSIKVKEEKEDKND